jgi:hypothetical protein
MKLDLMQIKIRYITQGKILFIKWEWVEFLPSLKRISYLPCDDLCKDSMGVLREMVNARMSTISKKALRY